MPRGLFPTLLVIAVLAAAWRPLLDQAHQVDGAPARPTSGPVVVTDPGDPSGGRVRVAPAPREDDDAAPAAPATQGSGAPAGGAPTPTWRVRGLRGMQPEARTAFDEALMQARLDGVPAIVRSGWRSAAEQQRLYDEAVRRHGSQQAAAREILPPARSAHVKGTAVDVHPRSAARWLEEHGAAHGICRRYANEWWHFEYVGSSSCPAVLPDPRYG